MARHRFVSSLTSSSSSLISRVSSSPSPLQLLRSPSPATAPAGLRSLSYSSALRSLQCSLPRWSHDADSRSSAGLGAQIRTATPAIEQFQRKTATMASEHPFKGISTSLPKPGGGEFGKFYSLPALNDPRIVATNGMEKIIDWENTAPKQVEKPARVHLQVPVNLVIDHSVNKERFGFPKWGSAAFRNTLVVPTGSRSVHQGAIPKEEQEKVAKSDSSATEGISSKSGAAHLRPLSPHLPIYRPQLTSTFSILNRISGAFLSAVVLSYYLLYLKIGLISFENLFPLFDLSSKLINMSVMISGLALSYHLYQGIRHLV